MNNTIDDLLTFMYNGGKITHEDWCDDEWITIKDGEFVNESNTIFTISPWMIQDCGFKKLEE